MTALAAASYLAVPAAIGSRLLIWPVVFVAGFALSGVWTVAVVLIGQRFRGAELSSAYGPAASSTASAASPAR